MLEWAELLSGLIWTLSGLSLDHRSLRRELLMGVIDQKSNGLGKDQQTEQKWRTGQKCWVGVVNVDQHKHCPVLNGAH